MCIKNETFFADVVEWNDKTIVLEYRDTHTQTRIGLEDANGFAQLLGRKRKNVWVAVVDATLRHVAWVNGRRGGTELHCSNDTNKWYRRV